MNNTSNSSEIQNKKSTYSDVTLTLTLPPPYLSHSFGPGTFAFELSYLQPRFWKNPGSDPGYEQQRHGTATSRSLTSNTVTERLADRDWCTKSQSSLLNINFRLSGFQSSLLLVYFRYGLNTSSHYTKVWHLSDMWRSTFEISAAQLRSVTESAPKSPFLCVNRSPIRYGFRPEGGVLGISSDGDDRRIFLGLKFSILGFFWVRKFGKYFFG